MNLSHQVEKRGAVAGAGPAGRGDLPALRVGLAGRPTTPDRGPPGQPLRAGAGRAAPRAAGTGSVRPPTRGRNRGSGRIPTSLPGDAAALIGSLFRAESRRSGWRGLRGPGSGDDQTGGVAWRRRCLAPLFGRVPGHGPAARVPSAWSTRPTTTTCNATSPSRCRTDTASSQWPTAKPIWPKPVCWRRWTIPHIVPVHDVGRTADGLCYVVSKFVAGQRLASPAATGSAPVRGSGGARGHGGRGLAPRPPAAVWSTATSSRPTSCSMNRAGQSWRTSGWHCARRTSAPAQSWPARLPT